MEHEDNMLDQYREMLQKEKSQGQDTDFFSIEELHQLIHSRRFTQYEHRCLTKNLFILLFLVLFVGSLVALYFTLLYSHMVWSVVAGLLCVSFFILLCMHISDRYFLWRIRPTLMNDDDNFPFIAQKLNQRLEHRYERIHSFMHRTSVHPRLAPITGVAFGSVAVVIMLIVLFPFRNSDMCSSLMTEDQLVVCNQHSCKTSQYYQMVYSDLDNKGIY